jgi:hypothetical protein
MDPVVREINRCTQLNFPIKAFYSDVTGNCHVFYRQGQGFTIDLINPTEPRCEEIADSDLGTMYLVFDKAPKPKGQCLVVRSSNSILFFKINPETGLWEEYHRIDEMRG